MRTPLTLATILLLTTLAAVPAPGSAAAADGVTLVVEAPPRLLSDHESFQWTHTLTWEETQALGTDATALDLLADAVAARDSTYTVTWYDLDGDGTDENAFVDEVNGVHTDFTLILAGYFWALYENDESASVGINQIVLEPGDQIRLAYTGSPVDA